MHSGIDSNHLIHLERVDGVGLAGVGNPCCASRRSAYGRTGPTCLLRPQFTRLLHRSTDSLTDCSTDENAARTIDYLLPFNFFLPGPFRSLCSFLVDTTVPS